MSLPHVRGLHHELFDCAQPPTPACPSHEEPLHLHTNTIRNFFRRQGVSTKGSRGGRHGGSPAAHHKSTGPCEARLFYFTPRFGGMTGKTRSLSLSSLHQDALAHQRQGSRIFRVSNIHGERTLALKRQRAQGKHTA